MCIFERKKKEKKKKTRRGNIFPIGTQNFWLRSSGGFHYQKKIGPYDTCEEVAVGTVWDYKYIVL